MDCGPRPPGSRASSRTRTPARASLRSSGNASRAGRRRVRGAVMREAVIVASVRSGLAKSFRGSFNLTRPDDIAVRCVRELLRRVPEVDPAQVDDVILGAGFPEGPQGQNVGRTVAIMSGLPSSVPGSTVSRFCASGLNAVAIAARMIEGGSYDVAIAGGLESITMLQNDYNRKNLQNPWLLDHKKDIYMPMGQTAEVVAERYKVTRERQDAFALVSQQRTAAGQRDGKFADEIVPITVTMQTTDKVTGATSTKEVTVERDECNRPDTTLEGLSKLPPAFKEGGTVTAGNASQLSDGASVALLMSSARGTPPGARPPRVSRRFTARACGPDEMGIAPVFAGPKLLRHGRRLLKDIDLV